MLVGENLPYSGETVRSYPESRQTLQATCVLDVDVVQGSPTLVVAISHKNHDDTTWTTLAAFASSITATGIYKLDIAAVKEQVRWDFSFTAGSTGDFVRFVRSIIWRQNA